MTICRAMIAAIGAVGLAQATANALSAIADRAGTVPDWQIWCWELTSIAAWWAVFPVIWLAVARLRPPRVAWPIAGLAHIVLTVPVSAAHVALMMGLRVLVYALAGLAYDPFGQFLYEYPKDAASYALAALCFAIMQWILVARAAEPAAPDALPPPSTLVVRDGAVTHHVPIDEIEHAESAGNYVAIAWKGMTLMHRATLASVEAEFGPRGFVRVHRQRLVRRDAIRRMVSQPSGDFELVLESGAVVKGSRRHRL